MERKIDKIEKYLKKLMKDNGGSALEARLSSYYSYGGRIIRVSDHIGANSSGKLSIIIPKFRNGQNKDNYIINNHETGDISLLNYEETKELCRSFIYMASMFSAVKSPVEMELEKRDKFNEADAVKQLKGQIAELKKIADSKTEWHEKYKELCVHLKNMSAKQKARKDKAVSADADPGNTLTIDDINLKDAILGVPTDLFTPGQILCITSTCNSVLKKHNMKQIQLNVSKK